MQDKELNTAIETPSENTAPAVTEEPVAPQVSEETAAAANHTEPAPFEAAEPQTDTNEILTATEPEPEADRPLEDIAIIPKKKNIGKIIALSVTAAVVVAGVVVALILILGHPTVDNTYDPYRDGEHIDVVTSNYYSGVVEPEETVKVEKDDDLKIDKVFVEAGDTVKKGDKLFTYDSAQAKLDLEMAKLEYDGINNEIDDYTSQISELTKERAEADEDQKLDYTLQIQQAELNKNRSQMSLKSKKVEIENLEKKVKTEAVKAPIDGVIKSVSDTASGSDDDMDMDMSAGGSSSESAFITILTADSYRVKCSVDELNVNNIYDGMAVKVHSRADSSKVWDGTISKIDYESAGEKSDADTDFYYGMADSQSDSATSYTFYVALENSDGILLGQHVYVEPDEAVLTDDAAGDEAFDEGFDGEAELTADDIAVG